MISQINGKLISLNEGFVIIELGGLGLKVNMSTSSIRNFKLNEIISIVTHMHVREDSLDLFGFINESSKKLFLMLISISGIGPKLGMTILSGIEPEKLKTCIISGDVKTLTSISGVGAKTAKRIIIELKDKFSKVDDENLGFNDEKDSEISNNILNALISLGYSEIESKKVIEKLNLLNPDQNDKRIETLIKEALDILNGS
ncbi:Holliday junction branch migration protein RuvA [bacterium]|jgi:Holliday junction DNA helicase RuvA|nr:Holliday junction branch migration protein RuvA [bacterium]MBT4249901.1 Holliday junction branch migration protein RuvA [bacterium]MBT5734438.1 Holliday junction branch migration protein RuvA [bacterium]MBT6018789.1 Holliday junction branch migration protein RuvA [bacterium]MBT6777441.1 Holliday junction branch migration protein RuvA [bacterium]|tara:strand:- start:217 stop:819 length:603 start_codon:yes stop_codon:yes gene_type:complete